MIKKIFLSLLLSLKIISSNPDNCMTCYASSCMLGCSTAAIYNLSTELCMQGSLLTGSCIACKTGELCHKNCVYNFNYNNDLDIRCAQISGVMSAKYCLDCTLYADCFMGFPILTLLALHNGLNVTKESMTNSLKTRPIKKNNYQTPFNQKNPAEIV